MASTMNVFAKKLTGKTINAKEHSMPIPQILKMIFLVRLLGVSLPCVNWHRLMNDSSRKNATADAQWMMCEIFTGNWKNPTMSLAAGQLHGNKIIINPKMPANAEMIWSFAL